MNSWFLSYLANQGQFTEINHSDARNIRVNRYRFSYTKIRHDVPKGSVVGPFFVIIIHQSPSFEHSWSKFGYVYR
jgi:hypothetical protein